MMRQAATRTMPLLAVVGVALIVYGVQADAVAVLGAGLVVVGMWSGVATAELFTLVARPSQEEGEDGG